MADILLIHPDTVAQREIARQFGFAAWTAAAEVVLRKLGFACIERAPHSVLTQPGALRAHGMAVVGWLPEALWRPEWINVLRDSPIPLVLEGPLPAALWDLAGLSWSTETCPDFDEGVLDLCEPDLAETLVRRFGPLLRPGLSATGRRLTTRAHPLLFSTVTVPGDPIATALARPLLGLLPALLGKVLPGGEPSPAEEELPLLAGIALSTALPGLEHLADQARPAVARCLAALPRLSGPTAPALAAIAAHALGLPPRAPVELPPPAPEAPDELWLAWRLTGAPALADQLDALATEGLSRCGGWPAWKAVLLAGTAAGAGSPAGTRLIASLLEQGYLPTNGWFANGVVREGRLEARPGRTTSPWLLMALAAALAPRLTGGRALECLPRPTADECSPALRSKWLARPLTPLRCQARQAEVLVEGPAGPALARQGRVLTLGFQWLSDLVHAHTMPPLDVHYMDTAALPPGIQADLLTEAITDHARRSHVRILRLLPWPDAATFAITVRHDWDRKPPPQTLARLLAIEAEHGVRASWYFLHDRLDPPCMRELTAAGHEIGLHAARHSTKSAELAAVTAATGAPVLGETWHGAGDDYWNGPPSVAAAAAAGLAYTEFVPSVGDFPYLGYPVLDQRGEVGVLYGPVGITFTATTDAGADSPFKVMRKPDLPTSADAGRIWAAAGRYVCLLNHPDINVEVVEGWLRALPPGGIVMTAAEVARWWRLTHGPDGLKVRRTEDGWCVWAPEHVAAVGFEAGGRRRYVDLPVGETKLPDDL